jgi:hypothetical protein
VIEYIPSLIGSMQPIQFYSCFISFSCKDKTFADRLHSRMVQERLRVWYAPSDMRSGHKSVEQVDHAIRVHDKLLLVLTKASMESDWVRHEIQRAVEREQGEKRHVLFPLGLASKKAITAWSAFDSDSGKDLAKVIREYHIPDFSKWKDHDSFEEAFGDLLRDLKREGSTTAQSILIRRTRPKSVEVATQRAIPARGHDCKCRRATPLLFPTSGCTLRCAAMVALRSERVLRPSAFAALGVRGAFPGAIGQISARRGGRGILGLSARSVVQQHQPG